MGLISSGISKVRAFALPAGIGADGAVVAEPRTALVKWYSEWNDKLHQIYVNGEYAGATTDFEQRDLIVQMRTSAQIAARIEVYAVEPERANLDLSGELAPLERQTGRVEISWPRLQSLPFEAGAEIYSNNGAGDIDYDTPLTHKPKRIWSAWQDKGGFGLSEFGKSDFGFDGSAAIGFGKGIFGIGEFGFDADMVFWTSEELQAGAYKFALKIVDARGNEDEGQNETEPVAVIPSPEPAEELTIVSFDKATNELVLGVS